MTAIQTLTSQGANSNATAADLQNAHKAILKVTAKWCGPCQRIHSEFVHLCVTNSDNFSAFILDVDDAEAEEGDSKHLLQLLNATSLPTFVTFERGVEVQRCCGARMDSVRSLCKPWIHPVEIEENCGDGK